MIFEALRSEREDLAIYPRHGCFGGWSGVFFGNYSLEDSFTKISLG